MVKKYHSYYETLRELTRNMTVTAKTKKTLSLEYGFAKAVGLITACRRRGGKLIFIGNGASASISSHMAVDFWKNGKVDAIAFNDAALLTCISNDFGYANVFKKPIDKFARAGDVLIAISSSGKSENILKGTRAALSQKCKVISLSGFRGDNPLRSLGDVNFYVPSCSYGQVEVVHHSICHCMLDMIVSGLAKGRSQ